MLNCSSAESCPLRLVPLAFLFALGATSLASATDTNTTPTPTLLDLLASMNATLAEDHGLSQEDAASLASLEAELAGFEANQSTFNLNASLRLDDLSQRMTNVDLNVTSLSANQSTAQAALLDEIRQMRGDVSDLNRTTFEAWRLDNASLHDLVGLMRNNQDAESERFDALDANVSLANQRLWMGLYQTSGPDQGHPAWENLQTGLLKVSENQVELGNRSDEQRQRLDVLEQKTASAKQVEDVRTHVDALHAGQTWGFVREAGLLVLVVLLLGATVAAALQRSRAEAFAIPPSPARSVEEEAHQRALEAELEEVQREVSRRRQAAREEQLGLRPLRVVEPSDSRFRFRMPAPEAEFP